MIPTEIMERASSAKPTKAAISTLLLRPWCSSASSSFSRTFNNSSAVRTHPNMKPNINFMCSAESRVTLKHPQPTILGKPPGVDDFCKQKQPLYPHVIHDMSGFRSAPGSSPAPDSKDIVVTTARGDVSCTSSLRISVRLRRSSCASWSRRVLMKRTSVHLRRSRQRSATAAMDVHASSSSVLTRRLGLAIGSMEHSSKTFNQFTQNRRNCFSKAFVSPYFVAVYNVA
mmetsp:Transcript_114373/g.330426  ORF Transcript_114373/g.330426 Transcript_114373/m.330426 type:complete len:228 (-) Transcript_114373:614-1297(-)